jgi:hypothetical protein
MRIIFCLPGKSFSGNFLKSWTQLLSGCLNNGIDVVLSQRYNSNVYYVRAQCLGADVLRGIHQKPFDGKLPYDHIMWIDSDQVFEYNQLIKLISHKKDIVGGLYLMEGGQQFAAVAAKDWDEEYFKKNASFKFMSPPDLPPDNNNLIEVAYSGFGFLLIKYGVFENITYPWFEPQIIHFGNDISDFSSEDVSFCLKARRAGYKIYVDPSVVVGHEKSQILHLPKETVRIN